MRAALAAWFLLAATLGAAAQPAPEYRAFWVDTFNTRLNSPEDVATVVSRAVQAGANALFVQVRRRGDAWYLNSLEPLPDGVAIAPDFDPLQAVIAQAHGAGLQVHAYVAVSDIWNQTNPPASPSHVFNQHGLTVAGSVYPGRANWLTRTRIPDGAATSFGGHRFGTDFWLDPGHPDAEAYTVSVLIRLVSSYDIDGLHLERLQYPEFTVSPGQTTPTLEVGASVGYNDTSLERYRRRYDLPADLMPSAADESWGQWRREQVTAWMRRIYLGALAIKPSLVVSVAAFANGEAPASEDGWSSAEPSWRVFQDWRAWTEEGIVDLVVPMVYRAEHVSAGAESLTRWLAWTRGHLYARQAALGLGAYLNSIEGTLRQVRRALAPLDVAAPLVPESPRGVVLFSMGAHNAPVNQNPFASQRDTPYRSFEDLAAGLTTGRTSAGQPLEPTPLVPVFASAAPVPDLPWKTSPTTGHLQGIVRTRDGAAVDGAEIVIESTDQATRVTAARTDGGGFYGRVGLAPGAYRVLVTPLADGQYRSACTVTVSAGVVATLNLRVDRATPFTAACQ